MTQAAHRPVHIASAVTRRSGLSSVLLLNAVMVLSGTASSALAQTAVSWSATANGNWTTGSNWTGGTAPANSLTTNYALFNQSTGVTVSIDQTQSIAGIDFGTSAGTYTLSRIGNPNRTLTIGSYGIINNSANTQTITGGDLRLTLGAATSFQVNSTGALTISSSGSSMLLTATNTLTLGGNGSGLGTISTAIAGTGGTITKTGSGTWVLSSSSNTYSGGTFIGSSGGTAAGTLRLGASDALGSGGVTVYAGTLDTGTGSFTDTIGALTLGGGASGTTASIIGDGTLTLSGNLTYNAANNPAGASIAANLDLGSAARTFTVGDSSAAAADLTISGVISGPRNITKDGAGTLVLSGANTYTGTTTVSAGTAQLDANAPSGAAGALGNATSAVTLNDGSTGASDTALLIGASGVTVGRAVTVANSGTGTSYLGGNFTSGTADFTGNIVLNRDATFTAAGTSTVTFGTGAVSGSGALTKTGTGTVVLSGANTYTGKTSIQEGTLSVGSLNNVSGGSASSNLGAPTSVASGTIDLGGSGTSGTLLYTGAGETTDRVIDLAGTTGGGTIDASGSGALTFSSASTATGAGAKTLTLTGTSTAANTFAGAIVDNSALNKTSLVKSGTGMWTLSGNNTHTGGTTLNSGTLNLNSATALGGTAGTFTINAGTLNNTSGSAIVLAGNNGQIWNGDFTFTGTQDLNLGSGAITLNATPTITTSAGTLTVGGTISGSGQGLTKTGLGTLALTSATSSYTGITTINTGTLAVTTLGNGGSNSSIGAASNAAANLVLNGGTLQYTGGAGSSDRLFSVGTSGGTLDASGSGTLTLTNTGSIGFNSQSGARALTLTGGSDGALAAVIGDNGGATSLTKNGAGTWTLNGSGSNSYSGATTINAGTLALAKTGGAIAIAGNITLGDGSGVDTVRLDAANQIATTSVVTFAAAGTPTLNLNGYDQTLGSLSSSNTSAQVQLGSPAGSSTFTVGDSSSNTFAGVISGGSNAGLAKTGSGTLTLSGTNTYSGSTTVNQGTLAASGASSLGAAGGAVTVNSGGTLSLGGGTTITKSAPLTLTGTGTSASVGALHAGGGSGTTSKWNGNITLGGNATLTAADNLLIVGEGLTFTNTLGLGANTLTLHTPSAATVTPVFEPFPAYAQDPSNIVVNSKITGSGGITKTGSGTATLGAGSTGGNTFTGDTVVTGGKLILDGYNNTPAINSTNVYVGNASASPGTADSVVLQLGQLVNNSGPQNAIGTWNAGTNASTSNMTIYSDGVFKMNNANQGFANLTLQGGHVDEGNIINNPLLTLTGSVTTNASSRTALINNGNLAMSANGFTFTIASGTTASGVDLQIDSIVQNGVGYTGGAAGTSLVKAGAGKMVLTNLNTYSGITNITAGVLNIQHGSALGQTGTYQSDTSHGTVVQSGAALQLQGGITISSFESLTLNGTGTSSDGALRNVAGNNTYNGTVFLATDSRINADAGTTLTIANTSGVNSTIINGTIAGRNLTMGGSGNTVVSGGISSFVNNLTKDGSGTLTLAGLNSYAGATNVSAGTVKVTHSSGLAGSGVVVSDGAALQFAQDGSGNNISVVGVGATINGSGQSSAGAIQNLSGSNTYAGLVTLGSDSLITANSGTSLTLSGGIGTAAQGLIVGTAANNGNITVSGNVSGGGSLTKAGSGSLTFSGASTTFGTVNMNAGTLTFSGTAVSTGAVHLNGGSIFVSSSTTATTGAVDAVAGTTLTIASGGSIAADYAAGTTTFSGALAGAGEFQKDGAGTLVFNNTFTASNLTLTLNGGTLSLLGGQFTFGTIHITGNTVLDFNNSAGTFLSSTNLIIDSGVTVTVNNWTSVANNAALSTVWYATNTINGGTLGGVSQVGGTPLNQIGFTNYTGLTATWVSGTPNGWFNHEIRPTPEPSTYGLILVAGCVGVIGFRRYRRNRTSAA